MEESVLIKTVTSTLSKCILRLRKKLQEKEDDTGTSSAPLEEEQHQQPPPPPQEEQEKDEDGNDNDKGKDTNPERFNVEDDGMIPQVIQESENDQPTIVVQEEGWSSKPILIDNGFNIDFQTKRWSSHSIPIPIDNTSTAPPPFVPVLPLPPVLPLHGPISSMEQLQRIIHITQKEVWEQRRKRPRHLNSSVWKELSNTCLDLFTEASLNPFVSWASLVGGPSGPRRNNSCPSSNLVRDILSHVFDQTKRMDASKDGGGMEQGTTCPRATNTSTNTTPTTTTSTEINPNILLCRYDLFGTCDNDKCPYQHIRKLGKFTFQAKRTQAKDDKTETYLDFRLPHLKLPPPPVPYQKEKQGEEEQSEEEDMVPSVEENGLALEEVLEGDVSSSSSDEEMEAHDLDQETLSFEVQVPTVQDGTLEALAENLESNAAEQDVNAGQSQQIPIMGDKGKAQEGKKRKADQMESQNDNKSTLNEEMMNEFQDECDFIKLPDVEEIDVSQNGDVSNQGWDTESVMSEQSNGTSNGNFLLENITDIVSRFGFAISPDSNQMQHKTRDSIFFEESNSGYPFESRDDLCSVTRGLTSLSSGIDAARLCMNAGRYELSTSILQCVEDILNKAKCSFTTHHIILDVILRLLNDTKEVIEGYFFGNESVTCYTVFHSQLMLSIIAFVTRSCFQIIVQQNRENCGNLLGGREHESCDEVLARLFQWYCATYFQCTFGETEGFNTDDTSGPFSFPYHLIPAENRRTNFMKHSVHDRLGLLLICVAHGHRLAKSIASAIFVKNQLSNPQMILDEALHPLLKLIQKHRAECKDSIGKEGFEKIMDGGGLDMEYSGLPTQTATLSLYAPSIFTCISAIVNLLVRASPGTPLSLSQEGTILEVKKILTQVLELFDFSDTVGKSLECQLFLSPFFGLFSMILIALGSFAKSQVLLEEALYSPSSSESDTGSWSVYSELLWSHLIQLRMCFPCSTSGTRKENQISLQQYERDDDSLYKRPLQYGCHLSKIILSGDSGLMRCALFFAEGQIDAAQNQELANIIESVKNVRLLCVDLVSSSPKSFVSEEGKNLLRREEYVSEKLESKRIKGDIAEGHCCNISMTILKEQLDQYGIHECTFIPQFPRSLLCFGTSLTKLILNHCGLESVPVTFGSCFPKLRVSILGISCFLYSKLKRQRLNIPILQVLALSHNKLYELPKSVGALDRLEKLDISHNRFSSLTSTSISSIANLEILIASSNLLTDISVLNDCNSGIKQIDLRNNQISEVPTTLLLKLNQLEMLSLEGNPVSGY